MRLPAQLLRLLACALLLWGALGVRAQAPAPLLLHDRLQEVAAWQAIRVLSDPTRSMTLADAQAARDRFQPPTGPHATLGLRKDAVWLLLPVQVAPGSDGRWLLDIGYAPLNHVDLYVVTGRGPPEHHRMGNQVGLSQRPFPSRTPTTPLALAPGGTTELWLRIETRGAMILPVTLSTPAAFHASTMAGQLLQGLLCGLGACLLLYSLVQALSLRETMFLRYALQLGGSLVFIVAQNGLGALYLWPDNAWAERHVIGVAALLAASGTFLFVEVVLRGPTPRPLFTRCMYGGAMALAVSAVAHLAGWLDRHQVSAIVGTLGMLPALIGLHGAFSLARQGDAIGKTFLLAWLGYFVTTGVLIGVIQGALPANGWTLHAFQIGNTLDMLLFMRVVTLRLRRTHEAAQQAARESDTLRSLAFSDALTGLPNRRGLAQQVDQRLQQAGTGRLMALYLLDLDGFKAVNDQHGHETGDALLVAVADNLRRHLPAGDIVARLGGDEFVVLADRLPDAEAAEAFGRSLLHAFSTPLAAGEHRLQVGLTIGYVLAPMDGRDVSSLMRAADAAMYTGKQAGKNRLARGGAGGAGGTGRSRATRASRPATLS